VHLDFEVKQAADTLLRDLYMPAHNARFAVKAEQNGTAFVAIPGVNHGEVLCIQAERRVGNDNCVSFNRLKLQIPASPCGRTSSERPSRSANTVTAHAIFQGRPCQIETATVATAAAFTGRLTQPMETSHARGLGMSMTSDYDPLVAATSTLATAM
jgi:hypothetical protein